MICESCGEDSGRYNLCKNAIIFLKMVNLSSVKNVANGIVQIQIAKVPQLKVMIHNNLKNLFIILSRRSLLKQKKDFIMLLKSLSPITTCFFHR